MKKILTIVIGIATLVLAGGVVLAQSGNDLFQQALVKERTEGNLQEAIKLYQAIVQKYASDHKLAAKALFQMGQAYEKLGSAEARKTYERIAREFSDQKDVVADATGRLAALGGTRLPESVASRLVWSGRDVDFGASIMPDGRLLITDWSTGDLATRDLSTGQSKRLMVKSETFKESNSYGETPVMSPDLRQVAFTWWDDARKIFELRVTSLEAGSKPRALIRNAEFKTIAVSAWALDGKSVLVNLVKQDGTTQIAWVSVGDGTTRVLRSLDWRLRGPSRLSPDGRYVVYFASDGSDLRNTGIYILAGDGSSENVLVKPTGFNGQPTWTPDGRHLVYLSDRSGSLSLWSIAVEDGKGEGAPVLVKSDVGMFSPVGFTRSGSYYYGQSNGTEDIFIGDLEAASGKIKGHAAVTERFVGSNRTPAWSPDGKFIAFHSLRQRSNNYLADVVVQSIDTGQEKTYAMELMRVAGNPVWFRDGKALLQAMRDQQGRVSFYRVDLKTGEFKQLVATGATSNSVQSALSPDQGIVYTNLAGGSAGSPGIRAFNLASGQQSQVFTAPENGGVTGLGLSPDGRTLAFKLVYNGKQETHVCVIGIDGKNFRDLYADTADVDRVRPQLAWAKDGRTILFTRYPSYQEWQLMRISAEGGKPEFTGLAGKGTAGIDLSADGSRIAFNDGTPGVEALWALDNLPIVKAAR